VVNIIRALITGLYLHSSNSVSAQYNKGIPVRETANSWPSVQ